MENKIRTCKHCGEEKLLTDFYTRKTDKEGRETTCKKCKLEMRKKYELTCCICGKKFENTYSKARFCSDNCRGVNYSNRFSGENHPRYCQVELECSVCGKKFTRNPFEVNQHEVHYCSRKCKDNVRGERFSGINHPNYNHEKDMNERMVERKYPEYYEWRKSVFERDNYTCQCCGDDKGGNLNAHHINGYNWCIEGRINVDNGIALCDKCHKEYHYIYGYGDNTMLQYFQFMANKKILTHYQNSVTINQKWIKELEL